MKDIVKEKQNKTEDPKIIYERCKKRLEKAVIQLLYSFHIGSKNKKPDIDIIAKSLFVLEFVVSDKYVEKAAIDIKNKKIYLNQNFVNEINDDELIGLILHEIMHMILLSDMRFDLLEYKDHYLWNVAQDLWINDFLKNFNNISLPGELLIPDASHKYEIKILKQAIDITKIKDYSDNELYQTIGVITEIDKKTSEQIYKELLDIQSKIKEQLKGKIVGGYSEIYITIDNNKERKCENISELSDVLGKDIVEGLVNEIDKAINNSIDKHRGNITASEKLEVLLNRKRFDIRPILMKIKNKLKSIGNAKMKLTKGKIHKKRTIKTIINNSGFIIKKKDNVTLNGVVYIDTSGSISDESLKAVLDKVSSLISQTNGKLILKMFDTIVYDLGTYTREKLKNKITAVGRGGTDISPVINDIKSYKYNKKDNIVLMLYSDLYYGYVDEKDINMFDIVMIDNEKNVNTNELKNINSNKIIEIKPVKL